MVKNDNSIRFEGKIIETLPNYSFRVKLNNNHEVFATLSGRMKKNNISVVVGDNVEIEVSPYDLYKGRIIRRN